MKPRDPDVPRFAYLLAAVAGLFFTVLMFWLVSFLGDLLEYGPYRYDPVAPALALALCYSLAGGGFGLVWPESGWRWGVWLSAAPVCLLSFLGPNAASFLGFGAVTLLPSCACAHAAARLHLRFVRVN